MTHFRYTAFDSLNSGNLPDLESLTLASHNKFSRSPTLSPLLCPYDVPHLLPKPRFDDSNDFQSNSFSHSPGSSHFAGLGITYPQSRGMYTNASTQKHGMAFVDTGYTPEPHPQSRTSVKTEPDDPSKSLQLGELSCFYDPKIANLWPLSLLNINQQSPFDFPGSHCRSSYPQADLDTGITPNIYSHMVASSGKPANCLEDYSTAAVHFSSLHYMSHSSSGALNSFTSGSSLLEGLYDDQCSLLSISPIYRSDVPSPDASWASAMQLEPSHLSGTFSNNRLSEPDMSRDLILSSPFSCLEVPSQPWKNIFDIDAEGISRSNELGFESIAPEKLEGNSHYEVFLPPVKLEEEDDDDDDFRLSDFEHLQNKWSPISSSTTHENKKPPRENVKRARAAKAKNATPATRKQRKTRQRIEVISEALVQHSPSVKQERRLDIDLGTPVLNAHQGIDLEELISKAERYRLRNPGCVYDNRWLASFAGKLSGLGECTSEYRCYVQGCSQVNKRRDHILIHVGSHLDQRPYACVYCTARFLRKNECKRHEASHTGVKPFVCHICPDTAFVRQDLLKRHSTRAHGIQTVRKRKAVKEENNENSPISWKRVRKEYSM